MISAVQISIYALNGLIISITFYLIFLYLKSDTFKIYPCYNIMILSFIVFFDNIFRIIPIYNIEALKYAQAYILTLFDKLLLTTITSQCIIIYLGVCHNNFYSLNEKKIFLSNLITGIIISVIISLLYMLVGDKGYAEYTTYFYCKNSDVKRITDIIFNFILLLINVALTLLLLGYIGVKRKKVSLGLIEDLDYGHHFTKIILMFLVNILLFIESYLIIFDKFDGFGDGVVDLIYLVTCLLVLFYYTINKIIIKETQKICCKKYYNKKYPNNNNLCDDDEEDDQINNNDKTYDDDEDD